VRGGGGTWLVGRGREHVSTETCGAEDADMEDKVMEGEERNHT
jgi:hypothetical protein